MLTKQRVSFTLRATRIEAPQDMAARKPRSEDEQLMLDVTQLVANKLEVTNEKRGSPPL